MFTRDFIENFLKDYSEEEKIKIQKDLKIAEEITFDSAKANNSNPIYMATAGGPGSAKTIETFLINNKIENFVYADPDQVSLKNMNFTYRKSLSNYNFAIAQSNREALKNAYDKWRGASNYICHEILQKAFGNNDSKGDKYCVAHGTTSTSPHISSLYQRIKNLGYRIVLLLCYSPDEVRKNAVELREKEQGFVQSDPSDVINKGIDFPKRFDTYFEFSDEIYFYWNEELKHGKLPSICARYIKNSPNPMTIINETEWTNFCAKYLQDINQQENKICDSLKPFIPQLLLDKNKESSSSYLQNLSIYYQNSNVAKGISSSNNKLISTFTSKV